MTRGRMMAEMTAAEFTHWQAYYRLEPWGERQADWRAALCAWAALSSWRGEDDDPLEIEDLMPDHDGAVAQQRKLRAARKLAAWLEGLRAEEEGDGG